ncbi:hypothetical protein E4U54_007227, partial [Claviceps lovelessii]
MSNLFSGISWSLLQIGYISQSRGKPSAGVAFTFTSPGHIKVDDSPSMPLVTDRSKEGTSSAELVGRNYGLICRQHDGNGTQKTWLTQRFSNARLRGGSTKPSGQKSPSTSNGGQPTPIDTASPGSQSSTTFAPKVPPLPNSPSLAQTIGMDESSGVMSSGDDIIKKYTLPRPLPMWLNANYVKHIVKGNFMTLSARPKTVEQGEWIAHQVVEHYRNLWNFVRVVHEKEDDGTSICNATSCPRMSAGA